MFVPVKIVGERVEYQQFEAFGESLKDMSGPLGYVGERMLEGVGKQFDTEGASGDRPWDQLTDLYRQWKETHGPGLPILVGLKAVGQKGTRQAPVMGKTYEKSGKMRAEMLAPTAVKVTANRMTYMPISDIAALHQEGTPRMVARPPVVIPLRELEEWDGAFVEWLDGLIEQAGL